MARSSRQASSLIGQAAQANVSATRSGLLTPQMVEAMRKHGFTNYKREWWHFSFNAADDGKAFDLPIALR